MKRKTSEQLPERLRRMFTYDELSALDTLNAPLCLELAAILEDLPPKFVAHSLASTIVGLYASMGDESGERAREAVYRFANVASCAEDLGFTYR